MSDGKLRHTGTKLGARPGPVAKVSRFTVLSWAPCYLGPMQIGFEFESSLPNVVRDATAKCCPHCPDVTVTEWSVVIRRSDGELRVYGSADEHTPGLLAEASTRLAEHR